MFITLYVQRRCQSHHSQASSNASSPNPSPFLAYFESTAPTSPAKHARLRTALFLQTSTAYDASAAKACLAPHAPLLAPKLVIIAGKVRRACHQFIITNKRGAIMIIRYFWGPLARRRAGGAFAPRANRTRPHVRRGVLHVPRRGGAPARSRTPRRACWPGRVGASFPTPTHIKCRPTGRQP